MSNNCVFEGLNLKLRSKSGKDSKAAQIHNLAFQKLGAYTAEQIPDLAPIRNLKDIGSAVVELLSTI